MNYGNFSTDRYYEASVTTSSPEQLVVMLYEGAIRLLKQAKTQIETKDLNAKRHTVNRALAIVQHLQSTLDMERGGAIAAHLDRIYAYVVSKILEGSIHLKTAPIEEAVKLLETLLTSWQEIAQPKQAPKPSGLARVMVG